MLVTKASVQAGEWVLIWGIGGGVATAAFEISRALGARTIVTSGSDDKLEQARAWGADLAVNHHTGDVVKAVKEATGKGVEIVVETVGEATWARSLSAVAPAGRVTVCGATSGPNPPAALHRFWWKQLTVYGSSMGTREDFLGAYDLVSHRPGPRARRHGVPARRDACRTRTARGRRPARQDRPLDPVGIHCLRRRGRHGDGRRSRSRHRLDKPPLDRLNGDSPNVQAKPTLRGVVEQPAGADTDTTCPAQWSGRGETKRGLRASGNRGRNHHDGRHPLVGRSSAERVRPPA